MQTYDKFIAGSIAGITSTVVGYPIDTIKVNLQTKNNENIMNIIKKQKFTNLFRGIKYPVMAEFINNGLIFGSYSNFRKIYEKYGYIGDKNILLSSISGTFLSSLVISPMELIKIKHQLRIKKLHNRIYTGFSATLLRDIPFNLFYFYSYEYSKKHFFKKYNETTSYLLSGGLAGLFAWSIVYPTDVVKTLIQSNEHKSNIMQTACNIYQKNKFKGFYKGYVPTLFRSIPVNAVAFCTYEYAMKILK